MNNELNSATQAQAMPELNEPTAELVQRLTDYANEPGYSHGDYADTMKQAAHCIGQLVWCVELYQRRYAELASGLLDNGCEIATDEDGKVWVRNTRAEKTEHQIDLQVAAHGKKESEQNQALTMLESPNCAGQVAAPPSPQPVAESVPQHIPGNFTTHRTAWRDAITECINREMANSDRAAYWTHELAAYDRAFARLLDNPEPVRPAAALQPVAGMTDAQVKSLDEIAKWLDSSTQVQQIGPDEWSHASQFDYELAQAASEISGIVSSLTGNAGDQKGGA